MRICIVYDCLYPYTVGGAERWYRNLAERLAAAGHDVTYLTLRQWSTRERLDVDPRVRVTVVGPRMALYTDQRRSIAPPIVFGLGVFRHLLRYGRGYDVVHTAATPFFSVLAAGSLRRLHGFMLVVDWHEMWSRSYWQEYLGRWAGAVAYRVQSVCAKFPQRAFCFSRLHARRLRGEGLNGRVTVLEGEYAGSMDAPVVTAVDPVVIFAGRLIPEKRVTLALTAVARAAAHIEGLRGEFYGDGPERTRLLQAILDEGVERIVTARGFVDATILDQAMHHALCMLSTSRREGYGMVVVEAAAAGTPSIVVAGEDNAATELIEDGVNGFVVETPDAYAIADAIVRVSEGGLGLRESTARWFARNAPRLSIDSSLDTVLRGYDQQGLAGGDTADGLVARPTRN